VEYLKSKHGLGKCQFQLLQNRLEQMGYDLFDSTLKANWTGLSFETFPTADAVFQQKYLDETPAHRLRGRQDNPCQEFDLAPLSNTNPVKP